MDKQPKLGIIGGTGVYQFEALSQVREQFVTTPFGPPSSALIHGQINNHPVVFLARHGQGHTIPPSEINYRANIYALKAAGVNQIVSISACGSLREDYTPGDIVIPDQLFDFSKNRKRTFFETGLVAHVGVADPFCTRLSQILFEAVSSTTTNVHYGGTFITIEGPRFSTKAESYLFRTWGMSIVGMTTSPEAFLAREAEICYAAFAHVTDYDVWHETEESVNVEMIIKNLHRNNQIAQASIVKLFELNSPQDCSCSSALSGAITTGIEAIDSHQKIKLDLLVNKYLP
ncbi:MAG: methylthioadenosine phosphorylase [Chloroflexi bacterium 44-23]|nr:MAG: methylthioadenosine phosphorylase [Chloroflexi bacterium 44-23]